jgi:hypothetical protein
MQQGDENQIPGAAPAPDYSEPYVDADAIADYLDCERRVVLAMARAGDIPGHFLRHGQRRKIWRFRVSEVDRAILSRIQETSSRILDQLLPQQRHNLSQERQPEGSVVRDASWHNPTQNRRELIWLNNIQGAQHLISRILFPWIARFAFSGSLPNWDNLCTQRGCA